MYECISNEREYMRNLNQKTLRNIEVIFCIYKQYCIKCMHLFHRNRKSYSHKRQNSNLRTPINGDTHPWTSFTSFDKLVIWQLTCLHYYQVQNVNNIMSIDTKVNRYRITVETTNILSYLYTGKMLTGEKYEHNHTDYSTMSFHIRTLLLKLCNITPDGRC